MRLPHFGLNKLQMPKRPKYILPLIIFSQFAGTSIWFAGNAILPDLILEFGMESKDLASITSSVQLGFITGTLLFAFFLIADRFNPSKVFFMCAVFGAFSNLLIIFFASSFTILLSLRFITGLMLAGIYPIGMKIASDWYQHGLGKALGFLVGALVLGTAFPHLIKGLGQVLDWRIVIILVSSLAALGGAMILKFVKNGPYRKPIQSIQFKRVFSLFSKKDFRSATFGYFGHMWELYTFWAFVPIILIYYQDTTSTIFNVSLWSFTIIAVGGFGCVIGGLIALKKGSGNVAFYHLLVSGTCILLFPLAIELSKPYFLLYLAIWGWSVVTDSPQFSTLSAKYAPNELVGTGLTIMNSIGFALTIISIYFMNLALNYTSMRYAILVLLPGPLFGLLSIFRLKENKKSNNI